MLWNYWSKPLAVCVFILALAFTDSAKAENSVEVLLNQLKAVQANENATTDELRSANSIVSQILLKFPTSNAATNILLKREYEGIDFSSFERRLAAETSVTPVLVPKIPTFLTELRADTVPDVACIANAYTPTARTQMRIQVSVQTGGVITGLPELLAPLAPAGEVRKDYFGIGTATENCAPLTSWSTAGEYIVTISDSGEYSVQNATKAGAAVDAATVQPTIVNPPLSPLTLDFGFSTVETEAELALDRTAIRDVQARLLALGHNPNGVDGVLGNGARTALAAWQTSTGKVATGYLNAPQLQHLQQVSEAQLALWLQDPANEAIYNPPIATPQKKKRKKQRRRLCKRNAIGILYDCRIIYR